VRKVVAEDEQEFLKKQLALLGKSKPGADGPAPNAASSPQVQASADKSAVKYVHLGVSIGHSRAVPNR
jgi:hypothetical protein